MIARSSSRWPFSKTIWSTRADLPVPPVFGWNAASGIVAQLQGNWTLHRRADGRVLMDGAATFAAAGDGHFIYRESGQAVMADGQSFQAERSYIYTNRDDGFSVFFAEKPPRLFHDVVLREIAGTPTGDACHPCGDDLYLSRYEFLRDGTFTIRHDVSGPRKTYILKTSYARAAAA